MTSQQQRFVKVTDVNPHLLCVLCGGYYVDATTIIECLHSFCKSCIVRYLETNKYCPICDVQVHKTKPLLNIRSDRTLQAIVNKLVPGLFQRELNCRKEFYKSHLKAVSSNGSSSAGVAEDCPIYLPDEPILLGVQYINPTDGKGCNKRYLRCPAAITVYHLQKLMRAKFSLSPSQSVEFLHDGESLPDFMSLMDLAYMYNWRRKNPIELEYRLLECQQKRMKLSHGEDTPSPVLTTSTNQPAAKDRSGAESGQPPARPEDQPDREVQLQISENGVMSVQSVASCAAGKPDPPVLSSKPAGLEGKPVPKRCSPARDAQPETKKLATSFVNASATNHLPVTATENTSSSVESGVTDGSVAGSSAQTCSRAKSQGKANPTPPAPVDEVRKDMKNSENKLKINLNNNNSITPNHIAQAMGGHPVSVANTSVTLQKVYPGAVRDNSHPSKLLNMKDSRINFKVHEPNVSIVKTSEKPPQTKPTNNTRYKTLKTPVKPWNPSIARSTIMAMKQAQLANQEKLDPGKVVAKSSKFFKMRNMPRFLGNPASGVKPMYQVLSGPDLGAQSPQTSTSQSSKQTSEVTVMKIDPKTLNPIPVTRPTKSPKLSSPPGLKKLPMFTNSHPRTAESPAPVTIKTQIRNPVSKSANTFKTNPNQVHGVSLPTSPSLQTNPFLLPPHPSPHMMYGGFPRPFPSVDSTPGRMPSESQILRAMSMFCSPNAAFHSSLPPSISMLFNPHHPHHRSSNDKLKYAPSEFQKASTTPSVQRVPPSGPASKHPPGAHQTDAADVSKATSSRQDQVVNSAVGKSLNNDKLGSSRRTLETQENKPSSGVNDNKNSRTTPVSSAQESPQNSAPRESVPLSNGFPEPPVQSFSSNASTKLSLSESSSAGNVTPSKTPDTSTSEGEKQNKPDVSFSHSS